MSALPGQGTSNGGAVQAAPLVRMAPLVRCILNAAVLALAFAMTGCYSYSVIDPAAAGPGRNVRARISPMESARIEELTGVRDRVLEGEIVAVDSAALVLSIPTVVTEPGMSPNRLHQRITLSSGAIVELEERKLSRWRTYSLIGAAAALAGYVVTTQFDSDDGEPGSDKPDPNNAVLSFRFRFR